MKGSNSFVRFNPETWQEEPLLWTENCKLLSNLDCIAILWKPMSKKTRALYWDIKGAYSGCAKQTSRERDTAYDQNMRGEFSIVPFSLQLGANESEALRNIEKRIFVLDRHNNHFEIFTKSIHLSKQRLLAEIRRQASAAASLFLLRS